MASTLGLGDGESSRDHRDTYTPSLLLGEAQPAILHQPQSSHALGTEGKGGKNGWSLPEKSEKLIKKKAQIAFKN